MRTEGTGRWPGDALGLRAILTAVILVAAVGTTVLIAVRLAAPARTGPSATMVTEASGTSPTAAAAPSNTKVRSTAMAATTSPYRSTTTAPLPAHLPPGAQPLYVPILVYHYVDIAPPPAGPLAGALTVSTSDFKAQMGYLADSGYNTVTLEQIYLAMAGEAELPPKPVALTFDDGGLDNYTEVFPELKDKGFVATFFVITDAVGKQGEMNWDQLREMQQNGMCVGSHTLRHPDLREIDDARLQTELADSRAAISRELGVAPTVLCYPGGKFDSRIVEAAYNAGFLLAVSTQFGIELRPEEIYHWPRVWVTPAESIDEFARSLG